jgi:hypothetical protein
MSELEDLKEWHLKDPIVSQRGAKSCPLECRQSSVTLSVGTIDCPVSSPFGASTYGNDEQTTRKTLELSLEAQQLPQWEAITQWALRYIESHSERLFKKKLTAAQVLENFKPPFKQSGDYKPLLRTKINLSGPRAVRCWDASGAQVPVPDDLRGVPLSAKVRLDRLWIMSKEYGLVLEVTDLQLHEAPGAAVCPF